MATMGSDGTTTSAPLLGALADPTSKEAVRFGDRALDYRGLAAAARGVVDAVEGRRRLAVFAPDYAPEEIAEIAEKLRQAAGLPKEPTGVVASNGGGQGRQELAHGRHSSRPRGDVRARRPSGERRPGWVR